MATTTVTEMDVPEVEVTDNISSGDTKEDKSTFSKLRKRFKTESTSRKPSSMFSIAFIIV